MPVLIVFLLAAALGQAQKYNGPVPPQPDLPYLLHATRLLPVDATEAKEEKKKNDTIYFVPGPAAQARTPLAEPIFLIKTAKIVPEKLELYRMEVKNGRREIQFPERKKSGPRPYPLSVTRLGDGLFRIEAGATLENGQYSLTPAGSNQVFSFEVF